MEEKEILSAIADTFTDKPRHTFTIQIREPEPVTQPNYTWLDWIRRKPKPEPIEPITERHFTITPSSLANSARMAGRIVLLPEEIASGRLVDVTIPLFLEHRQDMIYIVASAIQNTRREPDDELIDFINHNFDNWDLYQALHYALDCFGMQSFLNSTVLVRNITILKTSPLDESE